MAGVLFDQIIEKFNPYHGKDGRFSSANGATSFTYAPGKSKAHDLAIQREKERQATDGGSARSCKSIGAEDAAKMRKSMGQDLDPHLDDDAKMLKDKNAGYFGTKNSFTINQKIRRGEELTEDEQKTVDTIDRLMTPLPEGIKVTRMATSAFMERLAAKEYGDLATCAPRDEDRCFESLKTALVGGKVTEASYMSTSYDAGKNNFKTREVKMEINVPKGTKALFSPTDDEAEILLAKNTSYRIDNIINRGYGDITMEVTVIAA